jgi:hypothetical protein
MVMVSLILPASRATRAVKGQQPSSGEDSPGQVMASCRRPVGKPTLTSPIRQVMADLELARTTLTGRSWCESADIYAIAWHADKK